MSGKGVPYALDQRVYEIASSATTWTVASMSQQLGAAEAAVEEALARLASVGLVRPAPAAPGGYAAVAPEVALTRLFGQEERQLTQQLAKLAETREAITSVMRDFLDLRTTRRRTLQVEPLPTEGLVAEFLDGAAGLARREAWWMHAGGIPSVEALDEMLLRNLGMLGAGIAVRALFLHRHAGDPVMAGYLRDLVHAGAEVRIATHLPQQMVVVDQDLALVPADPADPGRGAWAVHGTELIPTLRAIHEHCWTLATPFARQADGAAPDTTASPVEDVLVRLLAEGVKDDAIARRLGVSTRTLSRMISALLERLGVQTRFQAALELHRRGRLADPVTTPRAA